MNGPLKPRFGYWSRCENTTVLPTREQKQTNKAPQINISALAPQQRAETWQQIQANNPALAQLLIEARDFVKAFDAEVILDSKDLDK